MISISIPLFSFNEYVGLSTAKKQQILNMTIFYELIKLVRILLWRWNQLVGGMMGRPKTICFVQPWLASYGSLGDKIYIFACFCFYLRPLLIFGSANVKTELSAYANQERGSKYGHAP